MVVKKKDASLRVCIDYREINRVVVKDKYPLPLIEDQIDKLSKAKVFSTLDLKNGFFHVNVEKNSRKYTSLVIYNGQYQFLKTPFGFCNAPSVFQTFINCIFQKLMNDGIMTLYMDDIIILSADENEAVKNLTLVLKEASDYGLEITFKKCQFIKNKIEFLGQIIEKGNVYPSPEKVKAVQNFPEPKNVKNVQSFLGLSGYFRKFIKSYSIIARPLSNLLRNETSFKFGFEEREAFNNLKKALIKNPVLKIFDYNDKTELHIDACQDGFGAILLQEAPDNTLHPVHYFSRKTNNAERNYQSYELEVLAVIEALKKFRVYLLGLEFKIITNCIAFTQTMKKKDVSAKIWRWASLLEDFNYTIELNE